MSDVSHIRIENLLTLLRTAVRGMNPMPGTDTAALGARRHVLGDREGSAGYPNTFVVNAENSQILGLDTVHVRIVCNGEGTTLQVVDALKGNKSAVVHHRGEVAETHGG